MNIRCLVQRSLLRMLFLLGTFCLFCINAQAQTKIRANHINLADNFAFTGNLTTGNINNVLLVDGTQYATCAAAITAAGSVNKTIILVPSTYAGAECPKQTNVDGEQETITTPNITIWDFRGRNIGHNMDFNSNAQDASNQINTKFSVMGYWSDLPRANTSSAILGTNFITGATPTKSFAGITAETVTTGTLSTPGGGVVLGVEGYTAIRSLTQTLDDVRGGTFSVNIDRSPATTNITTASSLFADKCTNSSTSGATIANCYSLFASYPTAGTTRNYSANLNGKSLLGFIASVGSGIDAEDSRGVARSFISIDTSNNTNVRAINANGLFLRDNTGTAQATVTTSGVAIGAGSAVSSSGAGGTMAARIASGNGLALGTNSIVSKACATTVTATATGVATTDVVSWSFNADPNGVTGYGFGATGTLSVWAFPTANNVNFRVCNLTGGAIVPGAISVNWIVTR